MRALSIIVPTLDEEASIAGCLASLSELDAEIIVADGGSCDATREIARDAGAEVIVTKRGRGAQLRAGASAASGAALLFLHADSILAPGSAAVVATTLEDPGFNVGRFRLRFDAAHPLLSLYARCARLDSLWTTFGDQGMLIRRSLYDRLGGFPDWPLLEDVELFRRARRVGSVRLLQTEIITSARRFAGRGIVRQQLLNAAIITGYLLGVAPERFVRRYAPHGTDRSEGVVRDLSETSSHP